MKLRRFHALLGLSAALSLSAVACDAPTSEEASDYATADGTHLVQLTGRTARDLLTGLQFVDEVLLGDLGEGALHMEVWEAEWKGEDYLSYGLFTEVEAGTVEVLRCSYPVATVTPLSRVGCQVYGVASSKETYQGLVFAGDAASGAVALATLLEALPVSLPGTSCGAIDGEHEDGGAYECVIDDEAWYQPSGDLGVFDIDGFPAVHVEGELAETVFDLLASSGEVDHEGSSDDLEEIRVGTIECFRAPNAVCEMRTDEVSYDLFGDGGEKVTFTNAQTTDDAMPSDILYGAMRLLAEDGAPNVIEHDQEDGFVYSSGPFTCYSYLGETPACDVVPMESDGAN